VQVSRPNSGETVYYGDFIGYSVRGRRHGDSSTEVFEPIPNIESEEFTPEVEARYFPEKVKIFTSARPSEQSLAAPDQNEKPQTSRKSFIVRRWVAAINANGFVEVDRPCSGHTVYYGTFIGRWIAGRTCLDDGEEIFEPIGDVEEEVFTSEVAARHLPEQVKTFRRA
jgi:hypothetical protein